MHELYIAESILKSTASSLPQGIRPDAVRRILVRVGRLDAVVPESLEFVFDAIKKSYGMPAAELWLEPEDVLCRCLDCGREFEVDAPCFICPFCGRARVEVLRGRGITLTRIVAEDLEEAGNGNTAGS
jgi:hydrogenase nickel incorporation protein HypA/HybF